MEDIFLVGVGMTPFSRLASATVKGLTDLAVMSALKDADTTKSQIDAAFFSNTTQSPLEGQYMVPGEMALRAMGFSDIPIINIENACASSSTALHTAYAHLRAGLCDTALVVGVEKMTHPDKSKSLQVFDGAWDVHDVEATVSRLADLARDMEAPEDNNGPRSVFMDVYAALARFHMKTFGTTQRQIAAVSEKNHFHSTFNPLAQYQVEMSVDQILAAPVISWPLTLPMCAPVTDGAAAAILVRKDGLRRFDADRAVKVCASVLGSGSDRAPDDYEKHVCRRLAMKAYDIAGIGPSDISLAEVHDATAFAEIVQLENLGFCKFGEGGIISERGETRLGGRIPVNLSGGLESKGHPIAATGLGQIYEMVTQLRGEAGQRQVDGARFAIAENGGGFHRYEEAVACITILGR